MRRLLSLGLMVGVTAASAQQITLPPRPLPPALPAATVTATMLTPVAKAFSPEMLKRLSVPDGFSLKVVATQLGNARMLHVMNDGSIYLTRNEQGDVMLLKDVNRDGVIEGSERAVVAQNLRNIHGVTDRAGKLYLTVDKTVMVADILPGGKLSTPRIFVKNLPDVGQHFARGVAFGPDGFLYLSVGSTCNDCRDPNPETATMLRIAPDGSSREVYARGLRHTIGFDWQPGTGKLFGLDQGSDWHGDDQPPEELNQIVRNQDYGWPYCFANQQADPYVNNPPPGNLKKEAFCTTQTKGSMLTYTAHAAAISFSFYTGTQFPAEYRHDAFATFRGSWNRSEPSGYQLARVHFDEQGNPVSITPFVSGFVYHDDAQTEANGWAQFGRLAGMAQDTDGSLLFTDDQSGVLYRLSYTGGQK
ncbi:PQQ-dependent sugar dehydrogenase (plasmid) [Deinococcus sp. KNUC1210]|uniref:PQQ-dependent sugar dehydrogenase n=1 Tax=Deinococcus sp. KNUC1210 TaxID=2917691 RepID=UPI001EEF82AD|nr:PQQ-dependent sugar dehydrogenase [Deinococcus sp. KNUC1210]ULH17141.1 PQQ-dependent sugar dehydrogenase [Deinococcus sp. KNUC1210]